MLLQVQEKPTDSPFWKGIMGVKNEFFQSSSFIIGDGLATRFLEDVWLGNTSLANHNPTLYNIVRIKIVLVADVLNQTLLNIMFNRALVGDKWDAWIQLVSRLMNVHFNDEHDRFKWHHTTTVSFLVKSMYVNIMNGRTIFLNKCLWKIKAPLKNKIFMLFLYKNSILIKDSLAKRRWTGCTKCVFLVTRK
jgi:hypothetical protein